MSDTTEQNTTEELTDNDLNEVVGGYSKTKTTELKTNKCDSEVLSKKVEKSIAAQGGDGSI